jgi:hypothetical protein
VDTFNETDLLDEVDEYFHNGEERTDSQVPEDDEA